MDDDIRKAAANSVVSRAHQAYDLNLSVTFVPSSKIPSLVRAGCAPRQGGERVEVEPVTLPEPTHRFLTEANKSITAWLARDPSHQAAFLTDPLAALSKAGIDVDRSHQKALARLRESLGAAETVAPGLQLRSLRSSVNVKGRVKPAATESDWKAPAESDCGCDHKKEG